MRARAAALLLLTGCGSLKPSMAYTSGEEVSSAPFRVALSVQVVPGPAGGEGQAEIEAGDEIPMAASLTESLAADLNKNGPFKVDAHDPDARLHLRVDVSEKGDTTAWNSVPPWIWWLFALPTYSRKIEVAAQARLTSLSGELLAEVSARDDCRRFTGLYYNWSIGFSCPVESVMEELKKKLSRNRDAIVARASRPRVTPAATLSMGMPRPPPRPAPPSVVVAVFDVEDIAGRMDERTAAQMTDYLAARVAALAGYHVVPRDQLRARLAETKAEGYKSCFEESCQIELGKALAAQKSIATKVLGVGKVCALTSTLYDLKTETTERAASTKTDCTEDGLLAGIDAIVKQLETRR